MLLQPTINFVNWIMQVNLIRHARPLQKLLDFSFPLTTSWRNYTGRTETLFRQVYTSCMYDQA